MSVRFRIPVRYPFLPTVVTALLYILPVTGMCQTRIEGHVTVDGLPANRVFVQLLFAGETIAEDWTDRTGHYELIDIPHDAAYTLQVEPDSAILAACELECTVGGEEFHREDIQLENLTQQPLLIANLTVMATAYPSRGTLPDGRVDLLHGGRRLGTVYLGGKKEGTIDGLLVPLGTIEAVALDRYGLYRPEPRTIEILDGKTAYRADFDCGLHWWKPFLALCALGLPAIQEIVRRRLHSRRGNAGENA